MMPAIVIYKGVAYTVPRVPFETDEQVFDRAWWIAQKMPPTEAAFQEAWNASLVWMHEKYFGVTYNVLCAKV